MSLVYGSVCSGIEAASVAWHPLGWRASFFAETEPFPRAVLAHHYPEVPCHGDFTTIEAGQYAALDVLVGGTPCQSFSVAGLRGGLDDDRGNLALEFCRLARRLRPRWVVWENVPGVLSLDGGRAFASILGGLADCGYGLAYRVLDAQFVRVDGFRRAVPQRRRRVFVVGYLGDWRRAAAVLFERESLSGHSPPRRQAGQDVAPTLASRTRGGGGLGTDSDCDGGLIAAPTAVSACLNAGGQRRTDAESETLIPCICAGGGFDDAIEHASDATRGCRVGSRSADEDWASEGDSVVAFDEPQVTSGENRSNPQPGDPCHPLARGARPPLLVHGALAFHARQDPDSGPVTHPLDTDGSSIGVLVRDTGGADQYPQSSCIHAPDAKWASEGALKWRVRRLMPVECERLQGFPDGYTAIPYRRRMAADGPRYKALGNSMAVNVMRWLGRRIEAVGAIRG